MADEIKNVTPPYVSYKTFKNTIRSFVHDGDVPSVIDNSLLGSMGGSTRTQFAGAMKFFELLGPKGEPSETLKRLALSTEPEWKRLIGQLVESKYASQLEPLRKGTPASLKASFGSDLSIVTAAARFLVSAAEDAGIPISGPIKQYGFPDTSNRKRKERPEASSGETAPDATEQTRQPQQSIQHALIEKFPAFDPSWDPAQQKAWMDIYATLLKSTGAFGGGREGE